MCSPGCGEVAPDHIFRLGRIPIGIAAQETNDPTFAVEDEAGWEHVNWKGCPGGAMGINEDAQIADSQPPEERFDGSSAFTVERKR